MTVYIYACHPMGGVWFGRTNAKRVEVGNDTCTLYGVSNKRFLDWLHKVNNTYSEPEWETAAVFSEKKNVRLDMSAFCYIDASIG